MGDIMSYMCPRCRGGEMKKRNGFSSCSVCSYQILNKDDADEKKKKKQENKD